MLTTAIAATVLVGTSGASPSSNAATRITASTATVKPDYAFFRGKTIHALVPSTVGSTQDRLIRAMMPSMQATLGATIEESLVPGTQVIGADEIANSAPDGLTFGTQGLASAIYSDVANTGPESFSLQKVTYFGGSKTTPSILVSCSGSSITSLTQLINTKTPVTYLDFPSSSGIIMHTLMAAYHVPVHYLTGYSTGAQLMVGCIRGDGDLAAAVNTNIAAAGSTSLPPGETLLAESSKFASGTSAAWMNNVASSTTITAFVKKHPIKNTADRRALNIAINATVDGPITTIFGPGNIPAGRAAAMAAAVKKAFATAAVKAVLLSASINLGYTAPAPMLSYIQTTVKHLPTIRKYVLGSGL